MSKAAGQQRITSAMQIFCKTEIPLKDCMGIEVRNSEDYISMPNQVKSRQQASLRKGIGFVWLKSTGLSAGKQNSQCKLFLSQS